MTLKWKQRKHTPTLCLPRLAFPPHFALSQTLGFYLPPVDFAADYFQPATVQLSITPEPSRALLFYSSGASLIEDKAQENCSM